MNKTTLYVKEIRSYQTLVYKNGARTFRKPDYAAYEWEMKDAIQKLTPIKGTVPIYIKLTYNIEAGVKPDEWRLVNAAGRTCGPIYKTKAEAEENKKSHHKIEHRPAIIQYAPKGDWDNLSKPIMDFMESMGIYLNDNQVVKPEIEFTFNNKRASVDIEIEELEIVEDSNGIYSFKRKKELL